MGVETSKVHVAMFCDTNQEHQCCTEAFTPGPPYSLASAEGDCCHQHVCAEGLSCCRRHQRLSSHLSQQLINNLLVQPGKLHVLDTGRRGRAAVS